MVNLSRIFKRKEENSEVKEAERRAYQKELEIVKREKKSKDVSEAAERGRQRARGIKTKKPPSETAKKIAGIGKKIIAVGEYGASLDWGGGMTPVPSRTKGKEKKRKVQKQAYRDPFAMPEFPF